MLFDTSRLIWRLWTGRLPTGVDRVCLAYLAHFSGQARAMAQVKNWRYVLHPKDSQRLFHLLLSEGTMSRWRLVACLTLAWWRRLLMPQKFDWQFYLNIGHTGLDQPNLSGWIRRHRLRAVFLIHDIIPITHPQFCRAGEAEVHTRRMVNALDAASGIIGNSQATLDELAQFSADHGLAMPPSLAAWICGNTIPQKMKPADLGRPYFITVGTIEGRKNHLLLLRIWQKLAESMGAETPLLVIVGQRGWEADDVFVLIDDCPVLRNHIREYGSCDDAMLAGLIMGARALLMPSHAEGFGLPVVEAMHLGVPVIASDLPVFHEIAGEIPCYLAVDDADGWERVVRDYLADCPDRQAQIAALQQYQAPDWPGHFAVVGAWLDQLDASTLP